MSKELNGPQIERGYLAGKSLRTLGKQFDCGNRAIRKVLVDRKVKLRDVGRPGIPDSEWERRRLIACNRCWSPRCGNCRSPPRDCSAT